MNEEKIVRTMIKYILEEEKKIINQKYFAKNTTKITIVRNMINELERVINSEN